MKTLPDFIKESFKIGKNKMADIYNYYPKNKKELREIISKLLSERGPNANLNDIDVSKITNMSWLFMDFDPQNINISEWDVSKVKYMKYMFLNCWDLNCDISNWNVKNVEDMEYMFFNCEKFNCDLDKWDVSNVELMTNMFYNCKSLKNKPSWYKV